MFRHKGLKFRLKLQATLLNQPAPGPADDEYLQSWCVRAQAQRSLQQYLLSLPSLNEAHQPHCNLVFCYVPFLAEVLPFAFVGPKARHVDAIVQDGCSPGDIVGAPESFI